MRKRSLYRKQKKTNSKKLLVIISAIVVAGALIAGGVLLWNHLKTTSTDSIDRPSFTFDTTTALDWWTSGSSWPSDQDVTQYEDSAPLPIVSFLAFEGVKDANDRIDQCFISASYYEGNVDISFALQEKEYGMIKGRENSVSLSKIGEVLQTIKTSEGGKEYVIHQYDLTPAEGEEYQRGNEFGYVQLENGYIHIFGVCPTADMLGSTISAISALELKL